MADRRERCSHCGTLLVVPPEAQIIKCAVCNGTTWIRRANNPLSVAYNSLSNAANNFRGLINTIMTGSVTSNVGYGTPNYGYGYYNPQPQPIRLPPTLVPPSTYGSKRAVLCGICYHGRSFSLKGSVNDVNCMRYFLMNRWGFPGDSILMLTGKNISSIVCIKAGLT